MHPLNIFHKAISLILPPTCPLCYNLIKQHQSLCDACLRKIEFIEDPICTICGMPLEPSSPQSHPCFDCLQKKPYFNWHRSTVIYKEPVNSLIFKLKYKARLEVLKLFATWMIKQQGSFIKEADFMIPVPLSLSRLCQRTFNQSLELAKMLSSLTQIPFFIHSLQKIKETKPQTKLARKERITNLWRSFYWKDKKNLIRDKKIILIDDVYSTGSTLSYCARALYPLKPKMIGALTIAGNVKKLVKG